MERLDELSKLLAVSVSRRESLRSIGVVLAGAALSPLGLSTAWAARPDRCTAFCRWCSTRKRRNQCLAACRDCNGNTSRLCGTCGAYACCPTGAACCNGICTDLNSDANNCSACGYVCAQPTPICNQGTCSGCPTGLTYCDPACVDLSTDPYNCGACNNQCAPSETCAGGVCQGSVACNFPFIPCGGVCVDPTSDRNNCGGCGVQCADDEACISGFCASG